MFLNDFHYPTYRYLPPFDENVPAPAEADRALINQHVNPYQEFPSLRLVL